MNWQINNIPDFCHPDQPEKFVCIGSYTFFTSSLIWGTIGPVRQYGPGGLYHNSLYGFLVGAVAPIPIYLLSRWKFPELRHVYTPILFSGGTNWAPFNMSWLIPSLYLGYIFQVYMRRRHFDWWSNYNVPSCISHLTVVSYIQCSDLRHCNCRHFYLFRLAVSPFQCKLVGEL